MGKGEIRVSDNKGVKRESVEEREKKGEREIVFHK